MLDNVSGSWSWRRTNHKGCGVWQTLSVNYKGAFIFARQVWKETVSLFLSFVVVFVFVFVIYEQSNFATEVWKELASGEGSRLEETRTMEKISDELSPHLLLCFLLLSTTFPWFWHFFVSHFLSLFLHFHFHFLLLWSTIYHHFLSYFCLSVSLCPTFTFFVNCQAYVENSRAHGQD